MGILVMSANSKQHKAKWFRIATAGDTTDGRAIQPNWIEEMASSYDPKIYGARINMEHFRSILPDSSFGAYGDVLALKAETVDVNGEQKLALFGLLQPNDQLIALNQRNQKIYTSVEIDPNFAKTGKAYLVGLAVTDSPASLGTEMLQFASQSQQNPFNARKQRPENVISAGAENHFDFEVSAFSTVLDKISSLFHKQEKQQNITAQSFADIETVMLELGEYTAQTMQSLDDLKTEFSQLQHQHQSLQQEFNQLQQQLNQTPQYPARPESTGVNVQADIDDIDC